MSRKKNATGADARQPEPPRARELADSLEVTPRVVLHRFSRTIAELAELEADDRVPCPDPANRELELCVDDSLIGRGRFVTEDGTTYFELTWVQEGDNG